MLTRRWRAIFQSRSTLSWQLNVNNKLLTLSIFCMRERCEVKTQTFIIIIIIIILSRIQTSGNECFTRMPKNEEFRVSLQQILSMIEYLSFYLTRTYLWTESISTQKVIFSFRPCEKSDWNWVQGSKKKRGKEDFEKKLLRVGNFPFSKIQMGCYFSFLF